jgi:hypothetical protein
MGSGWNGTILGVVLAAACGAARAGPIGNEHRDTREVRSPQTSSGHVHGSGHASRSGEAGREAPHDIETENMFGFTLGSDTDEAGVKVLALENVLRTGKRGGRYEALGQKLEFGFGVTDDFTSPSPCSATITASATFRVSMTCAAATPSTVLVRSSATAS